MYESNPFLLFPVKIKQIFHPSQSSCECGLTCMVNELMQTLLRICIINVK